MVMRDYKGETFIRQALKSHVSLCKIYPIQMKISAST